MVVDLKRCVGCQACVIACKSEHNTPQGVFQTSVLDREVGKFPNSNRIFLPVLCNHCEEPICTDVCPKQATYAREDGVVMIDFDKCIGCGACVEHCPYRARALVGDHRMLYPDGVTAFEKPVHEEIPRKVALKCDFCFHRIDQGKLPACATVCPTQARVFGDLDDEASGVNQLLKSYDEWQILPNEGTKPCIFYIGGE